LAFFSVRELFLQFFGSPFSFGAPVDCCLEFFAPRGLIFRLDCWFLQQNAFSWLFSWLDCCFFGSLALPSVLALRLIVVWTYALPMASFASWIVGSSEWDAFSWIFVSVGLLFLRFFGSPFCFGTPVDCCLDFFAPRGLIFWLDCWFLQQDAFSWIFSWLDCCFFGSLALPSVLVLRLIVVWTFLLPVASFSGWIVGSSDGMPFLGFFLGWIVVSLVLWLSLLFWCSG
jgi:hypothetical protein